MDLIFYLNDTFLNIKIMNTKCFIQNPILLEKKQQESLIRPLKYNISWMKLVSIFFLLISSNLMIPAQNLPPIFESTPKKLLKAKTLVAFPKNTWLENFAITKNGTLFLTNYPQGLVYKVSSDGAKKETYAKINGKIAGIATFKNDQFLVTGWDTLGKPSIFHINSDRKVDKITRIEGGMFPNGIINFYGETYLIADSYAGCIWLYDASSNRVTVWLKDKLLERSSEKSEFPAANGLKIYKDYLYISNTEKQTLVRVPLIKSKPGTPFEFLNKVNIDDFTFDDIGDIYAATNVYSSVIKISTKKEVSIVADLSSGVAGSTAVAFAKDQSGNRILYVSTSGGMALPPSTGIEEGKVIMLYLQ